MHATLQEKLDAIKAQLNLLSDTREFEDFLKEHTAELKTKENKNTIKTHIMGTMNVIIDYVNKMAIA